MNLRRRELIRRGAAAGGGALALPLLTSTPGAAAASRDDREVLAEALELERRLEKLYATLAERGGADAQTAELFRDHCREHARGLVIALANRGGDRQGEGPGGVPGASAAAALALENAAVAAYYRAHADFGDNLLLPTLTSIMANHGQHLAVLRRRLGERPATLAFETGRE